MSITRKWSRIPIAWAAAAALILPFAFGVVHAAEPEKTEKAAKTPTTVEAPAQPATIDTNKDGKADAWDRDSNGIPDAWDVNGDSKPDLFDNNGDGKPDDGKALPPPPEGDSAPEGQ